MDLDKLPKWRLEKPKHVDEFDDRHPGCLRQLRDRGFSSDELWSLANTIAEFTLPRLIAFRENCPSEKELGPEVDKMIAAFKLIVDEKNDESEKNRKTTSEGLRAFSDNFLGLWN